MKREFRDRYGTADGLRMYRAPGRVNLIGEHTDYNLGFVLPMALQLATTVGAAPAADGKLHIYSEDKDETREFEVTALGALTRTGHWSDYAIGVARELMLAGFPISPANLLIRSDVPEGAGLSSSAALEVSCALAFLKGRAMKPVELARLCQRAEVNFVGMPCGIMDQYIALLGKEGMAVEIDCRSLAHRTVPLPSGALFLATNSMVKHALASSAYKERVQECAAAMEPLQLEFPEAQTLRDITPEQFQSVGTSLPDLSQRRARHVVTENARVRLFAQASAEGDVAAMGRLMVESHRSLQHDYNVSCAELDALVDTAMQVNGVYGSRMTGGGFGGCTVTMLRPDALDQFQEQVTTAYERRFRITPQFQECLPSAGAAEVTS